MGKLKIFCVLALAVLLAVPAFAEVQNVKVSGDLAARYVVRANYDLDEDNVGTNADDTDDYLMSTAEVQVDADLTDNVATVVRLVNQRDWNDVDANEVVSAGDVDASQFDVIVDLANVTLKEFF